MEPFHQHPQDDKGDPKKGKKSEKGKSTLMIIPEVKLIMKIRVTKEW
jgi:hypothetical protein